MRRVCACGCVVLRARMRVMFICDVLLFIHFLSFPTYAALFDFEEIKMSEDETETITQIADVIQSSLAVNGQLAFPFYKQFWANINDSPESAAW